ncbi:N-terminal double-transmembrane domain-containing protein [Polaribacter sp. Hel1_33_78]|uniref:BatA domain-containing protein n=1 Tax=Polaribacter sp. Hel1_33_78 TaxID=1336804 RepID=UPI00087CF9CB|nr:BatA domain-containing protein [Polaribacter sp. Hel1_33_78]SDU01195.1 N-terminal double-transmembrane domain-containing protein [Polaribacter sp. Hel1_33_78]
MQFKNPEILYFLALLIIPILVHLFQLQKFVKTPFTNVAFLQKLVRETRKSSRLKKWLILCVRMLLFTAILFAFSQPYFSNKHVNKNQHTFIYLDNSLSTNSIGDKGNLLQISAQEIIENASKKDTYSLQTNDRLYKDITYSTLKKELLKVKNVSTKLDFVSIFLKIKSIQKNKTNTLYKNILISDFQTNYKKKFTNVTPSFSAIKLQSAQKNNVSIDSVFIDSTNKNNFIVNVVVKNQGEAKKNIPIAIFNSNILISKQSYSIKKNDTKIISFTIQNQSNFSGKIETTFNDTFTFDNTFYFNLNSTNKINILSIGNEANFLKKIYAKDEFNFTQSSLQNINYNSIQKQQLIILYELEKISDILSKSIIDYCNKGGNLIIIPNIKSEIKSYNIFLGKIASSKINPKISDTLKITNINFNHPLFKNVFSKKVRNFQYPTTQSHYPISSKNSSKIVSFENNSTFISQIKDANSRIYLFSSALNKNNSNFLNSPLIVPVFYNFGKLSFQHSKLYYYLGDKNYLDIEISLKKDEVLNISNSKSSFIPEQQTFQNKVNITTKEQPNNAGFYYIQRKKDTLQILAYNTPKEESILNFMDLNSLKEKNRNIHISASIANVFKDLNEKNEVHWLWKWFLALAIVSLLLEILILKFYKP